MKQCSIKIRLVLYSLMLYHKENVYKFTFSMILKSKYISYRRYLHLHY